MTILCIETSTSVCSAAICKDGKPIAQRICYEAANHAKLLPVYIDELLHLLREKGGRLDAVALSAGAGSYTGLRIGTSTAKGICYGLQLPLIPIPTLDILCASAVRRALSDIAPTAILCPMIDARRMEVYAALYDAEQKPLTPTQAIVVNDEEAILSTLPTAGNERPIYYFGDGAAKCQSVLAGKQWCFIADIVPEAQDLGALAEQAYTKGKGLTASEIAYYEPFYLKEFVAAQSHVKGLV